MNVIISKDNELIKYAKSLKEKKYRDKYNKYVIEGKKIIEEAIEAGQVIEKIIACDKFDVTNWSDLDVTCVSEAVFKSISNTVTPQGVLAIVNIPESKISDLNDNVIFALDNIQDPGNLGTIIRTLESTGIKTIILSKDTVDIYNPKVVRATMGAIFRMNLIDNVDLIEFLKNKGEHKVIVTDLSATKLHYEIDYNKSIVIIGNEANGVKKEIVDVADEKIKIPMLR